MQNNSKAFINISLC